MQKIVTSILEAPLPVIVWVAPQGAWAASAGTFITLSGTIALMAPGTTIGAASPVDSNGNDITGTEGPNKGKTIPAIYEHKGDTLKVCYNLGGQERPTEFKSKSGTRQKMWTFQREKK